MAAAAPQPKLLVIVGETASGKSALAFKLARKFGGEIISADSWSVYKDFDIGTSKPSATERQKVPHHLLDIVEAPQGFNAPKFKQLAETAIADIQDRGKLPILVGGTGLYIDSVLYDFGFLDNSTPEERQELDTTELKDLLKLAARRSIDLEGIDIRNKRRIIRAIEGGGQKPTKKDMKPQTLIIGLNTDNQTLQKRVEQRTEEMLEAGLEQEVKNLADKYGWEIEPMKGIGYQQWREYFSGTQSLEQTKQKIISATMKLAKRQRTWFKRSPDIQWFSSASQAYGFMADVLSN
jgi:tRNA dimethylallyltransferase